MPEVGYMNKVLIGISCMQDGQERILRNVWNTRFAGNSRNVILVETDKTQGPEDILNVICEKMRQQGIPRIQDRVLLAVFAELRDAGQADFIHKMQDMKKRLCESLACMVDGQLAFLYLDDCSMASAEVRVQLKETVRESLSDSFKTILSGRFALAPQEESWRAEAALLDVLCRAPEGLSEKLLPYGFGFLRYGRYQPEKRRELLKKQQKLEKRLYRDDQGGLKELVDRYVRERITDVIGDQCRPEEGMAPIAPEMLVTGWWSVRSAKKGNHEGYNRARGLTEDAVRETAACMEAYADELVETLAEEAGKILWELAEASDAGMVFLKNHSRMHELLQGERRFISHTELNLSGCVEMWEIQRNIYHYLDDVMQYLQVYAEMAFRDKLTEAYDSISPGQWYKKEVSYRNEYHHLCGCLNQYPELQAFCELVYEKKPVLQDSFIRNTGNSLASERYFLLHGDGLEGENKGFDVTSVHYDSKATGYMDVEVLVTVFYETINQEFDTVMNDLLKLEE